jgi:hypothetical protein
MKKSILSTSALVAFLALSTSRVLAHPDGHESAPQKPTAPDASAHGHEHTSKAPESVADILKEIDKQQDLLTKTVADKKLGDAHDHAFVIRDLAKALVGKVPEAKKADAEVAAKKIAEVATDIDKSSAAGAQKTTESNVKSMGQAIKTLQTILPHAH